MGQSFCPSVGKKGNERWNANARIDSNLSGDEEGSSWSAGLADLKSP